MSNEKTQIKISKIDASSATMIISQDHGDYWILVVPKNLDPDTGDFDMYLEAGPLYDGSDISLEAMQFFLTTAAETVEQGLSSRGLTADAILGAFSTDLTPLVEEERD